VSIQIDFICVLLTYISIHRTTTIGASLSAAQSFFELFDRIPTIDNATTKGRELVSEEDSKTCMVLLKYFLDEL
jgi:hypothetical protein